MRGKGRALVAVLIVIAIILATAYAYNRGWLSLPDDEHTPIPYQATMVNEREVSLDIQNVGAGVDLSTVRLTLYGPGLGQGQWRLSGGLDGAVDLLPGIDLSYQDDNGDGKLSAGDGVTIYSDEGLAHGVWHLNVAYPCGSGEFNESLRFQILPTGVEPFEDDLTVYFLNVGQGDAELVHTSDGKWVLIDAGPGAGTDMLLQQLEAHGVDRLEALIISHPHLDHYAGADEVLDAYEVRSVYHPGLASSASSFAKFLDAVDAEGCPVYTDEHLDPGDYLNISLSEDFRVMSIASSGDSNEASLVLLVANQNMSVLFTGDLGEDGEALFVEQWRNIDVDIDVLKVGHHGSRYSSTLEFIQLIRPEHAVIEVGADNSYGHPHGETLNLFAELEIKVYRTDIDGDVLIEQTMFS
ncbi:MAG: MBL fold metallo-hydrolase [Euryarchaeota archaeon]|nr:MBL fold metallo-hydrolase [Euryarchaeota archaeon]